jgi:hypothetical protein
MVVHPGHGPADASGWHFDYSMLSRSNPLSGLYILGGHMETATLIIDIITMGLLLISGWFLYKYFPSYFAEKGKNLATKEDIGEITHEIEKARIQYTSAIEVLRADLSRKSYMYNMKFEKEFEILFQIWGSLIDLMSVWRPIGSDTFEEKLSKDTEFFRFFEKEFRHKSKALIVLYEKYKPFYPEEINTLLARIIINISSEYRDFESRLENGQTEIDIRQISLFVERRTRIFNEIEDLCMLMRKRITPEG